jgi:hypothetical protein
MGEAVRSLDRVPRWHIRDAVIGDVYRLAANLRVEDYDEVRAAGARLPEALRTTFRHAVTRHTVLVDGEIAAMFGLGGQLLSDVGHPWLVTAPPIERVRFAFVREGRAIVADMMARRRLLENHVLASYTRACRFLAVLGFTLDAPAPFGHGALFRRFWMARGML